MAVRFVLRLRWAAALLTVLALGLIVAQAGASEHGNPLAPLPARVHAGDVLTLSWPGMPNDVREFEVLLSLDGGRSFSVRVSAEIEGDRRGMRWHIPNLATSEARLLVRANLEGAEVEFEPSESFVIVGRRDRPADRQVFNEGGWWVGLEASSHRAVAADLVSPGPRLDPADPVTSSCTPPRTHGALDDTRRPDPARVTSTPEPPPTPRAIRRTPPNVPKRE